MCHVFRGNLNYDGFRSVGSLVDDNGDFTIKSNSIIDGGLYYLQIGEKGFRLDLLKGDSLHLEFHLDDLEGSLSVSGVGAGKINLLRLESLGHIQLDEYDDIAQFHAQLEENQRSQLDLIQAVFDRDVKNPLISNAPDRVQLREIIDRTPLSEREYDFLKQQILIRKFDIASFIKRRGESMGLDSVDVISGHLSEIFKVENYVVINDLQHPWMANQLDEVLQVEYARHHLTDKSKIGFRDFTMIRRDTNYYKWIPDYLEENFDQEVFDKWIADGISWSMTMGRPYAARLEMFKDQISSKKYLDRLQGFDDLLGNGLRNPRYNLDNPDLTLDRSKFEALLESHHGESIYIIFWSAQFAGSSVIDHLPLIKNLAERYDDQFRIINICIDEINKKNLWAARIIDNELGRQSLLHANKRK